MGHYCRICGRERPNEQFSGKGHKIHVCKRCQAKPKTERRAIEDQDDIFGFLKQSHISEKNVTRLRQMAKSDNLHVASLATIVLEVARIKPYKTRRLKFLSQKHPELLRKLEDAGLILAYTWDWETTEVFAQANSEETEVFVPEDSEATDLSAQEDWEIPF
jgi:ribosome-binding protein aMBF1 (putative translation factor)